MKQIMATWAGFVRDESGATAIEYGLIGGLVSLAVIGGMTTIGQWIRSAFVAIATAIQPA
ncbi:MAG: Flp family type IVb pilin [Chelatococcus sp.]|nr:MAG: Flp family type IVb pilin [Chelatococcus sp.]